MALETLNKDSKVAVYNSDVDLADKGVRQNHQGVTAADLGGFIKVKDTAGAPSSGVKGDIVFSTNDKRIYIHDGSGFKKTVPLD